MNWLYGLHSSAFFIKGVYMGDLLFMFLVAYLVGGVVKATLVLPSLPAVCMVYHRYHKRKRTAFVWFLVLLPSTVGITMVMWPVLAATEGASFFLLYRRWGVMREVLFGIRHNWQ
jgi:hypothetical protein